MWVQGEPTQEEINEPFMEEDVSFPCQEEPDHIDPVHRMCIPVQSYGGARAIPNSGSMTFEGDIGEMLEAVAVLLGGAFAKVCISWEVCQGGADNDKD